MIGENRCFKGAHVLKILQLTSFTLTWFKQPFWLFEWSSLVLPPLHFICQIPVNFLLCRRSTHSCLWRTAYITCLWSKAYSSFFIFCWVSDWTAVYHWKWKIWSHRTISYSLFVHFVLICFLLLDLFEQGWPLALVIIHNHFFGDILQCFVKSLRIVNLVLNEEQAWPVCSRIHQNCVYVILNSVYWFRVNHIWIYDFIFFLKLWWSGWSQLSSIQITIRTTNRWNYSLYLRQI